MPVILQLSPKFAGIENYRSETHQFLIGQLNRISAYQLSMATKAEHYLQKAEQFEAMAQNAQVATAKAAYERLAWSYRQLGIHVNRGFKHATELDGLAERIVGSGKKAL